MSQQLQEDTLEQSLMDEIIDNHRDKIGSLLGILESLQNAHPNKYLPKSVIRYVSKKLKVPLSKIYNVTQIYLNNTINSSTKEDFLDLFYF